MVAVHVGASIELFIVQWARGKGSSPVRVEGSSRAMLATARPFCFFLFLVLAKRLAGKSVLKITCAVSSRTLTQSVFTVQ